SPAGQEYPETIAPPEGERRPQNARRQDDRFVATQNAREVPPGFAVPVGMEAPSSPQTDRLDRSGERPGIGEQIAVERHGHETGGAEEGEGGGGAGPGEPGPPRAHEPGGERQEGQTGGLLRGDHAARRHA